MQQATSAHSGVHTASSPANIVNHPTPSRRALLGLAVSAGAIAVTASAPALAITSPAWSAVDWLDRWARLGCGARLDGHRLLQLTTRAGQEADASALLGELGTPGRIEVIKALLDSVYEEDGAVRAVRQCRQIDSECILEDEDEVGHKAWLARSNAADERLLLVPARTGRGLADKLRIGLEMNGSDLGDRIVAQVLGQLERMA